MSSSDNAPVIKGTRFAVVTNDDHTGIIWVTSILCFVYAILIFVVRLEARRKIFGLDDILAIISTVFALLQYILIFLATSNGLGKSYALLTAVNAEKISKYVTVSNAMLLLSMAFAKCSVISLCGRLFSVHMRNHRIFCDVAMGVCGLWAVASIMAITIDCSSLNALGYETAFCHNLDTRWTAVGVLDSITEIAIVAMAFNGLQPLQMNFSRKMQAFATFALRLIIIAFAVMHIKTLRETTSSSNAGVTIIKPTVYLQVELLYALLSAAIPALNRWLRNFDTSMGSAWMHNSQAYGTNSKSRSESNAIPLSSFETSGEGNKRLSRLSVMSKTGSKRTSPAMKSGEFVPTGLYGASTEVSSISPVSGPRETVTSDSMDSDDMIIRKDVQWHVQYEHNGTHRGPQ